MRPVGCIAKFGAVGCAVVVAGCATGTPPPPVPQSAFDMAVECVQDRMQLRGAEYVERRLRDDSIDLVFSYEGFQVTYWITGRTGKTVTVSKMPGVRPQPSGAVMQTMADVAEHCTPSQTGL